MSPFLSRESPADLRAVAVALARLPVGKEVVAVCTAALGDVPPPELARSLLIRSEEHTSELQSQSNLVCRLLLEKKKARLHHDHVLAARHVLHDDRLGDEGVALAALGSLESRHLLRHVLVVAAVRGLDVYTPLA